MNLGNFIFVCPVTRLNVQGTVAMGDYEGQRFVTQHCPACQSIHLVDPLTGELAPRSPTDAGLLEGSRRGSAER